MSGDAVWVAVDGVTQATPLGNAALGLDYGVQQIDAFLDTCQVPLQKPLSWRFLLRA